MATHALTWQTSQVYGRHAAASSVVVSLLVQLAELLREVWRAVWASNLQRQPRHALRAPALVAEPAVHVGLTEDWVTVLHRWNHPDDDEPTEVIEFSPEQREYLLGNPYDSNGDAA